MPKSTFAASNVRRSGTDFPTLRLEKQGDHARVKLMESDPTYEWVHTLRKMKLSPVTGRPVMKTIQVGKEGEKEDKEVFDLDFVGTPICFGNDDILEDKGVDVDHCPICKAAMDYPDLYDCVAKPERKWAVHVYRYATKGSTTQPIDPLSGEIRVWKMSDNRYARVVSVLEEFAPNVDGDPLRVDLTLGPCNNTKFQNYEVQGSPRCALANSADDWARAESIFASNHVEDLSPYCGRKADPKYVKSDIDEIIAKFKAAQGGGVQVAEPDFSNTLSNSMLDSRPAAPVAAPAPAAPAASLSELDDTVGSPASAQEEAPAAEAPVKTEETVPATPQGGTPSFASLMDSIGVTK